MSDASFYPHGSLSSLCSTKGQSAMRLLSPLFINYRVFELAWASVETCHRVSSGKKPLSVIHVADGFEPEGFPYITDICVKMSGCVCVVFFSGQLRAKKGDLYERAGWE